MKIAVAVDGSGNSLRAVQMLVKYFRAFDELQVLLVNVQPPLRFFDLLPADKQALVARRDTLAGEEAAEAGREVLAAAGIAHRLEVVAGEPAEAIVECAVRNGCELVVMGTRGMGSAAGLVLGSVATRVVHLADMPVTLVK